MGPQAEMEERVNALEAIVKYLFPSATREHVLGDLRERFRSPVAFVFGAAATLPYVLWGQAHRNVDPGLTLVEASALIASFLVSINRVLGDGMVPFLMEQH